MSTRATYKLKNNDGMALDAYIHYDGYEEGALIYYLNAIEQMDKDLISEEIRPQVKGGFIENFLYANASLCEITDHKLHGDTEYHYEMSESEIKVYAKGWDDEEFNYKGTYTPLEFFNTYKKDIPPEIAARSYIEHNGRIINAHALFTKALNYLSSAERGIENRWIGNASSDATNAYKLLLLTSKAVTDDAELVSDSMELIKRKIWPMARKFAESYKWHLPKEGKDELSEKEIMWRLNEAEQEWIDRFYPLDKKAS